MNKKVFKTLEFDKIIAMLESHATSNKGREYCRRLAPFTDLHRIERAQQETEDALGRLMAWGSVSFAGTIDTKMMGKRLEVGGTLNAPELLRIASMLTSTRRACAYGRKRRPGASDDSLDALFASLDPCTRLEEEITHCILSEDEIADDASAGLANVRRRMAAANGQIRTQLNRMLNNRTIRDYLQDDVITMRDGRYCLSVKAENKNFVPGMVHDQSASGATLFIEPMSVVNLNNELRELELQEQEEIEKVLADLSAIVFSNIDSLNRDFEAMSELDFIFARASLARDMKATRPKFNEKGCINLKGARHPLLDKHKVVPIDLRLGKEYDLLVVTGPNTGGKTVSLKTCGLLTLMGQAGLHIPAEEHSELGVFDNVYADIGDEQSIEQSLSTFSSHMTNIIRILKGVDSVLANGREALVLFDELCAGTDPAEGAALATAILDGLHKKQVRTMATTHYSELKVYALSTPGVENACCEFSVETLSPTYRLLIGIPGKSNAFAISGKLGLPVDIIDDARNRINEEDQSFEDMVADLEQKRVQIDRTRKEIEQEKASIDRTKAQLDQRVEKLNASKDKILEDANLKAANILKDAKDMADKTIRKFNRYSQNQDTAELAKMEHDRQAVGRKLSQRQAKSAKNTKKKQDVNHNAPKAKDLHIGDRVKVLSMNMSGTVHSLPDKSGNLDVQMGIMRAHVKLDDIIRLSDQDTTTLEGSKIPGTGSAGRRRHSNTNGTPNASSFSKAATISPEIKLLGMTGDEAIAALDKYLDDARMSHLKEVRVVHGKGTGVLRQRVHEYLQGNPYVKDYHLAEFGQGDAGVTIVNLRE